MAIGAGGLNLGLNIIGKNQTRAAFAGVKNELAGLRTLGTQLRATFLGVAGGDIFAQFVKSIISANKEVPAVKNAIAGLQSTWQSFVLAVGQTGVIEGVVSLLETAFLGLRRGIGFAHDNLDRFKDLFIAFLGLAAGQKVLNIGIAFVKLASSIRISAIAMGLFHGASRAGTLTILALAAGVAAAVGKLEDFKGVLANLFGEVQKLLPQLGAGITQGLSELGFDISALTGELEGVAIASPPAADGIKKVADETKKLSENMKGVPKAAKEMKEEIKTGFEGIGEELTSPFKELLKKGEFSFKSFSDAIVQSARNMLGRLIDVFFKPFESLLEDMIIGAARGGAGGGGGIFGALFGSLFGGATAAGTGAGAGVSGATGFSAARAASPPLPSFAGASASARVNVYNMNGSQVGVQERTAANGMRELDLYIEAKATKAAGRTMRKGLPAGYGVNPSLLRFA